MFQFLGDQYTFAIFEAVLSMGVTIFVPLALMYIRKRTGIEVEAKHREALQSALQNGVKIGLRRVHQNFQSRGLDGDESFVINAAEQYVRESVPDAVKHFKLDGSRLRNLIVPHLPFPLNLAANLLKD